MANAITELFGMLVNTEETEGSQTDETSKAPEEPESPVELLVVVLGLVSASCALLFFGGGVAYADLALSEIWEFYEIGFLALLVICALMLVWASKHVGGFTRRGNYGFFAAVTGAGFAMGTVGGLTGGGTLLMVALPFLAFACVALIVFWSICLSFYEAASLRIIICLCIGCVGVAGLIVRNPFWACTAAGCCGLVSLLCAFLMQYRFRGESVKRLLRSKQEVQIRNHSFIIDSQTGLGLGATAGMASSLIAQGVSGETLLFWSCLAIVLAGFVSAVLMTVFKEKYFAKTKHMNTFLFSLGLLAFALLPTRALLMAYVYMMFTSIIFFCIHMSGTVEFLRYYNDHPVRMTCGSVVGAGTGMLASFSLFTIAQAGAEGGTPYACAIVIAALMAIHLGVIFYCSYPYDDRLEIEPQVASYGEGGGKGRQRRHMQVEVIAERYGLTVREKEILGFMARGRNAKYISDNLMISPSTTKTHIYHLYSKIGAHTQQELIDLVESIHA